MDRPHAGPRGCRARSQQVRACDTSGSRSDFPDRCVQYGVYGFDPFEDSGWDECLRECRELAYVMEYLKRSGHNDVEGVRWQVADITHRLSGEYIPDEP